MHVFRILFNLGDSTRKVEIYPFTLDELTTKDVAIPRDHYQMLQLPTYLKPECIDIPPIESNVSCGLTFISIKFRTLVKRMVQGIFIKLGCLYFTGSG